MSIVAKRILGGSVFLVMMVLGVVFGAVGAVDTYAYGVSLTIDTDTLDFDLAPQPDGTFASSTSANISVTSTNITGYTLSIASSSNNTDLTIAGGSNTISSIESAINESTFSTNTDYNNMWGYKPSTIYDTTNEQTLQNSNYRPLPGSIAEVLDKTTAANSTANTYTLSFGARVDMDIPSGIYSNNTYVIAAVGNFNGLTINYDGNGLYYNNDSTKTNNPVMYDATVEQQEMTKYSHTPNVNDAGTQSGDYPNNANTNDVITIPGATTIHVTLKYGSETNYDWTSFWEGSHPDYTAGANYSTGVKCGGNTDGRYMGNVATVECDITGDTVTFAFKSDGGDVGGGGFGYYAIVTGIGNVYSKTNIAGTYATPASTAGPYRLLGWSEDQNATTATYADETEVATKFPYVNADETVTLYAIYQKGLTIKFNPISSSGTGTGTMADQIIYTNDPQPLNASTFTPPTNMGLAKWNTSSDGTGTAYSNKGTYTVPTDIALGATQNLYAIWGKTIEALYDEAGKTKVDGHYTMQDAPANLCDNTYVGSSAELLDNRGATPQVYLVQKLADEKCWMLDNLRLDLVADKDTLSSSNTNATDAQLNYLKNGGGTTSDQYPTAGVAYWASSYSYSAPRIAIKNASNTNWNPDTTTTSYGAGSGKIGVYYNYCAASAGTYCWGNGTGTTGSPSSDPKSGTLIDIDGDICPAGWRMPTSSTNGEYQGLLTAYNNNKTATDSGSLQYSLSTPLSGSFLNGSASSQGSSGAFWSSTWNSTNNMYRLSVYPTSVAPSSSSGRVYGFSVRCLLGS